MAANKEETKSAICQVSPKDLIMAPLSSSSSIFQDHPVNTIFIQKVPPQDESLINKNIRGPSSPFSKYNPFAKFANIQSGNLCSGPTSNAFFDALFLAYVLHGEIVLSPDDVWLQINNCFAQYIDKFSEQFRDKIVTFQGKKDLIVLYDVLEPGFQDIRSPEFRWEVIAQNFNSLIQKNTIGNISELIECNFTTTGSIERLASQVSLMHSCEKYFNYRMVGKGCGIRKVHFLGSEEDWINLKEKVTALRKYKGDHKEFEHWVDNLETITEKFIETYNGDVDVDFWNGIVIQFKGFKLIEGIYGGRFDLSDFVNGWILDFFLFDKKNEFFVKNLIDRPLEKPESKNYEIYSKAGMTRKGTPMDCFPAGFLKAPVVIEFLLGLGIETRTAVYFLAGFENVINEDNVFRPQITFAVSERDITKEEKNLKPILQKNRR